GAETPSKAPAAGWVEMDIASSQKRSAVSRRLKPESSYAVFRVRPGDFLNTRKAPNPKSKIVAKLPHDAKSVKVTAERQTVGKDIWVKITHDGKTGWVNQNFLYETSKDQ
ncbi:MAG: SH3 domain-containing protein, partial [Blastocatellia bacterium]